MKRFFLMLIATIMVAGTVMLVSCEKEADEPIIPEQNKVEQSVLQAERETQIKALMERKAAQFRGKTSDDTGIIIGYNNDFTHLPGGYTEQYDGGLPNPNFMKSGVSLIYDSNRSADVVGGSTGNTSIGHLYIYLEAPGYEPTEWNLDFSYFVDDPRLSEDGALMNISLGSLIDSVYDPVFELTTFYEVGSGIFDGSISFYQDDNFEKGVWHSAPIFDLKEWVQDALDNNSFPGVDWEDIDKIEIELLSFGYTAPEILRWDNFYHEFTCEPTPTPNIMGDTYVGIGASQMPYITNFQVAPGADDYEWNYPSQGQGVYVIAGGDDNNYVTLQFNSVGQYTIQCQVYDEDYCTRWSNWDTHYFELEITGP